MSAIKLNHLLVQEYLVRRLMRAQDLAKYLGVSKQTVNFILHHGGVKYAPQLAKLFDCTENALLVGVEGAPRKWQKKTKRGRK